MNEENEEESDYSYNIETKLSKEKRLECRKIVKEIKDFGVSQRQILFLIQQLGLELENRETMIAITDAVKKHRDKIPVEEQKSTIIVSDE